MKSAKIIISLVLAVSMFVTAFGVGVVFLTMQDNVNEQLINTPSDSFAPEGDNEIPMEYVALNFLENYSQAENGFIGANLSLGENINLNYFAKLTNEDIANAYVEFTYNGNTFVSYPIEVT